MLDARHAFMHEHGTLIPVWRPTPTGCSCPRGDACISPGKHTAIDSGRPRIDRLRVLRDWFAGDRHNVGVVCGASGICVIDIDPRNDGAASFAALVAELGELPPTITADSGGGGTHYAFRRPPGELVSKLGKGVDFLHDARQFLVEPSIHPSGAMYRWRAHHAPDEIAIAELFASVDHEPSAARLRGRARLLEHSGSNGRGSTSPRSRGVRRRRTFFRRSTSRPT